MTKTERILTFLAMLIVGALGPHPLDAVATGISGFLLGCEVEDRLWRRHIAKTGLKLHE